MNAATGSAAALLEPSFADVIEHVGVTQELPQGKRTHWVCSLRKVADWLQKDPADVPARWSSIRFAVHDLHHEPIGVTAKTLANHKSNVRAALSWFAGAAGVPTRGAALTAEWSSLHARVSAHLERSRLSPLMRFCSASGIAPSEVTETVIDRYMDYRAEHTRLTIGLGARRALARSWNLCGETVADWPTIRLVEPPIQPAGIQWDELPEGLRSDIEQHLTRLAGPRRSARGKRLRPARSSTIATRQRELLAYVGKAVTCGFPLETLTAFEKLLQPEIATAVLDSYWASNGENPSVYTIDMAWKVVTIAREFGLDPGVIEQLEDLRAELDAYRQPGLTAKNRGVVRQVLTDEVWGKVMRLPEQLMAQAARDHNHRHVRAAVLAGVAVAIRILTLAPIRVGNLARIRIGENLIRPAGPSGPWWIVFPDYDVKNRQPLEYELDVTATALIDRYLVEFRPALQRGRRSDWLFPGEEGDCKGPTTLSEQITDRVFTATGMRITAHQFRHAAAAIFLKHRPGEYELVRRLLGHRSIATTTRFYAGLESLQATRIVGAELRDRLDPAQAKRKRQ